MRGCISRGPACPASSRQLAALNRLAEPKVAFRVQTRAALDFPGATLRKSKSPKFSVRHQKRSKIQRRGDDGGDGGSEGGG